MRKLILATTVMAFTVFASCSTSQEENKTTEQAALAPEPVAGQSGVVDDESQKNIVQIAIGSKDHTKLVKAVQAAGLVDVLSNAGPFTVFAPTNAAFDKLPAGTVEGLLKADKKDDLKNILQYHVYVGGLNTSNFTDGQQLGQVNGKNVTIKEVNGSYTVNGAKIIASIPASNGVIHVVDQVLLPQ
jgi:uncharacterized surface protein with fasciclin (FAS1) repeats